MARVILILGLVSALACGAFAAQCLAIPNAVGKGETCSAGVGCRSAFFCDKTGVCADRIAVGQPCDKALANCVTGATCKGEDPNTGICIAPVMIGGACNSSSFSSFPSCVNGASCTSFTLPTPVPTMLVTPVEYKCNGGGGYQDPCINNSTCNSGYFCEGGLCTASPIGSPCRNSFGGLKCVPGAYCDNNDNTCRAAKTTGLCPTSSECAFGYYCLGTVPTDTEFRCVAALSRQAGEYCGTYDFVCASPYRCSNNYCAANRVGACVSDDDCSGDELCLCDGLPKSNGIGQCTKNKCWDSTVAYETCAKTKCGITTTTPNLPSLPANAPGTCIYNNCLKEYNAKTECSPAARAVISVAGLIVALVAALYTSL